MSNYRRINNDTSVVVVGRTAPVIPGQQLAAGSLPVVLASDQPPVPVEEQNKIQSEVALSLLGIPRSEVALGIFADVNTYDVNPTEWSASPVEKKELLGTGSFELSGITKPMGWGLTHIPEESGALIEAPANKSTVLTSKRFFRYQPGRVSAATFGVKSSVSDNSAVSYLATTPEIPDYKVRNPPIRKYGIFDNYDGYYWETRGTGIGDQFCVVRRTQSLIKRPITEYGDGVTIPTGKQTEDYGIVGTGISTSTVISATSATVTGGKMITIKKSDIPNGQSINITKNMIPYLSGGDYTFPVSTAIQQVVDAGSSLRIFLNNELPSGNLYNIEFSNAGDLVVVRDGLLMTHAAMYDNSLLKDPTTIKIISCSLANKTFTLQGKTGLRLGQLVRYDKDLDGPDIIDTVNTYDTYIFRIFSIYNDGTNDIVTLKTLNRLDTNLVSPASEGTGLTKNYLKTPVPFIFPEALNTNTYTAADIMFPLKRDYGIAIPSGNRVTFPSSEGTQQGAIDTYIQPQNNTFASFKSQIDLVNDGTKCFAYANTSATALGTVDGWRRWILDNVKPEYYGVYEYRVPRSRFSADFLDVSADRPIVYSDIVRASDGTGGDVIKYPGQPVFDEGGDRTALRDSVWNMDFSKVTMNKIEFSWYGAVGALFLAYVPISNNEARWVRIHHLRASNQLKVASLGNATLPITYNVYGGGTEKAYGVKNLAREEYIGGRSSSEFITKYGASYYIDGGDRGTVRLFNFAQDDTTPVRTSSITLTANTLSADGAVDTARAAYLVVPSDKINDLFMYSTLSSGNIASNNTKVTFIETIAGTLSSRVYLSRGVPTGTSKDQIKFVFDSPQIVYGITSKTDITTSTGFKVRNRVQVYPTKLATGLIGSSSIISLRLLKNCTFQTADVYDWTKKIKVNTSIAVPASARKLNSAGLTTNILPGLSGTAGDVADGKQVYGWFRVHTEANVAANHSTLFGMLRKINSSYEFTPKESYTGNVYLLPESEFLIANNYDSAGNYISNSTSINLNKQEIERLSSVLIDLTNRRPIPNTGIELSNFFLANGSEVYDLTSYFDYNKDYISFPLTDIPDNLYLAVKTTLNTDTPQVACSLTWEEQ